MNAFPYSYRTTTVSELSFHLFTAVSLHLFGARLGKTSGLKPTNQNRDEAKHKAIC